MLVILLGMGLMQGQPTTAPGGNFEGRPIVHIDFLPEEQPLPRPELDRILPMREGDVLRLSSVRDSIQKLYATGRFSDISVDASGEGDGVRLVFSTELRYFVSRVSIQGEKEPPNRNQLATAARQDLGAPFHEDNVEVSRLKIEALLRANGLFGATVKSHVDLTDATEEASIYFDLMPGKRARFGGVELRSVDGQPLSDTTKASMIRAAGWHRSLAFIRLPGWQTMNENRLQTGIQEMQRDQQRDDRLQARVTLERLAYDPVKNRVTPVLTVDRGPIIEVRTVGEKVSKKRLQQLIPVYQERTVDRALLLEGQRNLRDYFQSQGYFDVVVDVPTQSEVSDGRSIIEYRIMRGDKHVLRAIQIDGNVFFDDATLRERMFMQPASLLRFRSGRYSPRLLQQDVAAIESLYKSNGFPDVKVTAKVVESQQKHSDISVVIQVVEGQQWTLNKLAILGVSPKDEEYLRTIVRSVEGQSFGAANVSADRDAILNYFLNDGYPDTTFQWEQSPAPEEAQLDAKFTIHPGKRQFVRGILVRGLETTSPTLVKSRILLREGDPLSQSQIGLSQQQLYDLGIFAKVETAIQNPGGDEESKYVVFYANEARRYSLNLGIGADLGRIGGGSSSGTAAFAPRVSVGVSRINFLGVGHTISLQTLASTQQRRALLNYLAPQFQGNPNLALTFSALFNDTRDIKTFSARRWEGSVQLAQRLSKSDTAQIRLTFRRVTLNSVAITQQLVPLLAQPVRVGLVGGTLFRDRRDDPVDSRRGAYNSLDLAVATAALGSQTSFTRLVVRNSTYHPFKKELVLARTVQFGYMGRTGGLIEIPLAERFFAGGASSHRGFPDNQAGPRDTDTGFPLGGTALLFHSTELRFPLIGDNLGGVIFHDMGNVFSDVGNISFRARQRDAKQPNPRDFDYMVHAVGGGIRYRTPVGPLRIDLAYGLNSPRFFGPTGSRSDLENAKPDIALCEQVHCELQRVNRFQFHFSLGQTF